MKRSNLLLLAISVILLAFIIIMGFVLDAYSVKIVPHNDLILYISSKILFGIIFLTIAGLGIVKQKSKNYIIQYASTIIVQFIPLAIRYLSLLKKGFVISIILLFISIVFVFCVDLGFFALDKKTTNASKELQGEIIVGTENKHEKN